MVRVPGPHTTSYDFSGIAEGPGGIGNKAPTSTLKSHSLLLYRNNLCAGLRGLSFALVTQFTFFAIHPSFHIHLPNVDTLPRPLRSFEAYCSTASCFQTLRSVDVSIPFRSLFYSLQLLDSQDTRLD